MSHSDVPALPAKEPGDSARRIGDIWQGLGLSGVFFGMDGSKRRSFRYAYVIAALVVALINSLNVITQMHDMPHLNLLEPLIWRVRAG